MAVKLTLKNKQIKTEYYYYYTKKIIKITQTFYCKKQNSSKLDVFKQAMI